MHESASVGETCFDNAYTQLSLGVRPRQSYTLDCAGAFSLCLCHEARSFNFDLAELVVDLQVVIRCAHRAYRLVDRRINCHQGALAS